MYKVKNAGMSVDIVLIVNHYGVPAKDVKIFLKNIQRELINRIWILPNL
jgi:hypothetical protein